MNGVKTGAPARLGGIVSCVSPAHGADGVGDSLHCDRVSSSKRPSASGFGYPGTASKRPSV